MAKAKKPTDKSLDQFVCDAMLATGLGIVLWTPDAVAELVRAAIDAYRKYEMQELRDRGITFEQLAHFLKSNSRRDSKAPSALPVAAVDSLR